MDRLSNTRAPGQRSFREGLGKLALLVTSVAFGLVVAETAIRVALPPHNLVERRTADLVGLLRADTLADFRYTSNFEGRHRSEDFEVTVLTDERGFRVPKAYEPSAEGLRILAVGNSLTFGWGVEGEEAWPAALEVELESRKGSPVTVANAGVASYNVDQMDALLHETLDQVDPDLVVLGVYTNGLSRLQNPFQLFSGSTVRANELPRLRTHPDGYMRSPLASPTGVALDLWLSSHFTVGALALEAVASAKASLFRPPAETENSPNGRAGRLMPVLGTQKVRETLEWLDGQGVEGVVMLLVTQDEHGRITENQREWAAIVEDGLRAAGRTHIFSTVPFVTPGANRFEHDQHWLPHTHAAVASALADSIVAWNLDQPR